MHDAAVRIGAAVCVAADGGAAEPPPGGGLETVAPIVSPRLLFESLFTGFVPPDADPAAVAEAEFQLARRKSVIDLVKTDADRLLGRLGGTDRQRMERHFDELRQLEMRLDMLEPLPEGSCALPRR